MKVEVIDWHSVEECRKNSDNKVYVFGDNLMSRGKGGQAIIRDEPNACGISTKAKPYRSEDSYFNDEGFEVYSLITDIEISTIKDLSEDKIIVFPKDGIGVGLAKMKEKAPKTYNYLCKRLKEEFGFDNETGSVVSLDSN